MQNLEKTTTHLVDVEDRMKMIEGIQIDMVQSFEEVRSNTCDLEKTASIWLPKYEEAAQIVNELSSRVEQMDEQVQALCVGGESSPLLQAMARVVESKVQGLEDVAVVSANLKDLFERVENGDHEHCQVLNNAH